jgi:hypothetical protein
VQPLTDFTRLLWQGLKKRGQALECAATMLFELGKIEVTSAAGEALKRNGQEPHEFVWLHVNGNWGNVPSWIADANISALDRNKRIMSSYRMADGQVLWVVTDADRSSTKVLLPWESVLTAAALSPWRNGWASYWRHSAVSPVGSRRRPICTGEPVIHCQH